MPSETENHPKQPLFIVVVIIICISTVLLCSFSVFTITLWFHFLPSPSYAIESRYYSICAGILSGSLWLVATLFTKRNPENTSGQKIVFMAISSTIIGCVIGFLLVDIVYPAGVALAIGVKTEIVYVVDEPYRPDSKYCIRPVKLAGLPTLDDELCGVPDSFRKSLSHGSEIVVGGRGTKMGLFVSSARLR